MTWCIDPTLLTYGFHHLLALAYYYLKTVKHIDNNYPTVSQCNYYFRLGQFSAGSTEENLQKIKDHKCSNKK
jgi:hypothetical protein